MTIPLNGGEPENRAVADQDQVPIFSFGIITDVHYCDQDSSGTKNYRESINRLQEAMNALTIDSVDFVVNLGDLIDNNYKSFKPVMNILDESGINIYHCLGNHDFLIKDNRKKDIPFDIPKSGYYSFSSDGFRFIFLNGNEISTYAPTKKKAIAEAENYLEKLGLDGAINANDWNGAISVGQLEWLMGELDESVKNGEKVFIFCHFPIFPESEYNLFNHVELLSAISGYDNIIAWFSGHNHSGGYGNYNRTHFISIRAMVEESPTTTFTRIDVYSNKIWLNGSGRERNMILAY
jgi:hypothetical protein